MKRCSFCAEEIQDAAVFCKHCKRDVPADSPSRLPSQTADTVQSHPTAASNSTPKLLGFGCLGLVGILLMLVMIASVTDPGNSTSSPSSPSSSSVKPSAQYAIPVSLDTLLRDYKENEIAADADHKGKWVKTTGIVGSIKKDLFDQPYVIIGHGRAFEIPEVQCALASSHVGAAANLVQGQTLTVTGKVSGLLMHVQMSDCTF